MTSLELFTAMTDVSGENLREAEKLQRGLPSRRTSPKIGRRAILAAALIAAMLLLVGCTVVYVLHMQDLKIGDRETTRDVFDEYHRDIVDSEVVAQHVLTLSGLEGSPGYLAAKEWLSFQRSYDPDGSIREAAFQNGDPEALFPQTYWAYGTYSQEMVDKLNTLSQKYELRLLGAPTQFGSMRGFTNAAGIDHLLLPDSDAALYLEDGTCYPGGNFRVSANLNMPQGDGMWHHTVYLQLYYSRKDCLSTEFQYLDSAAGWREWTYPTASGQTVLILREPEGSAYLFCDSGDATLTAVFTAGYDPLTDDPNFQPEWITDRQIEQLADAIDFTVRPQQPDAAQPNAGHAPGWEIETKEVYFDGAAARLVFHLTAPEGTILSDDERVLRVFPDNWNENMVISDAGQIHISFRKCGSMEDGDGLDNTADLLYIFTLETADDPAFPVDGVCTAHIEDLTASYMQDMQHVQTVLAEGVWELEFRFADCDRRAVECLDSPLTVTVSAFGSGEEAQQVTIESISLRNLGAVVTFSEGSSPATYLDVNIVMQNGTVIRTLSEGNYLLADTPVDLEQAEYLLFSDGTKIPVPARSPAA